MASLLDTNMNHYSIGFTYSMTSSCVTASPLLKSLKYILSQIKTVFKFIPNGRATHGLFKMRTSLSIQRLRVYAQPHPVMFAYEGLACAR